MQRIVVGIDGSAGSRRALLWAADEASLRRASLDVIHTYGPPENIASIGSATQADRLLGDAAEAARDLVDGMTVGIEHVPVTARAIESLDPARTLVEESAGAAMLVVSSRGRGSVRSMVLGSVSQQCAHHAECPVVIIRSIPAPPD